MAVEMILIVPDLIGPGNSLREKLIFLGWGSITSSAVLAGSGPSNSVERLGKEIAITLELNDKSHLFYTRAFDGHHFDNMRIEINDVTPTTLRAAMLFEFRHITVSNFQISGSSSGPASPRFSSTCMFESVKPSFFK